MHNCAINTENAMTTYSHTEICSIEVRRAYTERLGKKAGWAKAGRVVAGLLKAAAKSGSIKTSTHCGRVSGYSVSYLMDDEQLAAIRAEAISRAAV